MAKLIRGSIVWAMLDPTVGHEQQGKRPVLILSHEIFNHSSGTVIAVALTSQPQQAGFPLTLSLDAKASKVRSWVKISQIRTLSTKRLGSTIGHVSPATLEKVIEGLNEIIG